MEKDILMPLKEMQFSMSFIKYIRYSVLRLHKELHKIKEKENEMGILINIYLIIQSAN